ncbi:MAG: hypothetical protein A2Y17_03320 [Clostridiales bacterium GWF2_38_85]|nr:MAG: hypothetical protein A2Y17_03320 [Clostridiales bacterium GWF2_38_85]
MKIGVSLYSFYGYAQDNSLGVKGCIDKAAEWGIEGLDFIEVGLGYEDYLVYAADIKKHCVSAGIEPVCFCTGADFVNTPSGDIKSEIAKVKRNVDIAAVYGCKVMRHDVTGGFNSSIKVGRGYDNAIEIMVPAIREVTRYAEEKGVVTCVENHGFFSQDAARVEKLINAVNEKNFGALVDMGNFTCADEDSTKSVGLMAPYARHAHAKDFHIKSGSLDSPGEGWFNSRAGNYLRGSIIGHGNVAVRQCIDVLKRSGYNGYLAIEFEGMEDPLRGISVGFNNLKRYAGR